MHAYGEGGVGVSNKFPFMASRLAYLSVVTRSHRLHLIHYLKIIVNKFQLENMTFNKKGIVSYSNIIGSYGIIMGHGGVGVCFVPLNRNLP